MKECLYTLFLSLACTLFLPVQAQIVDEDFEDFPVGTPSSSLPSGHWTTWTGTQGGAEEGLISNEEASNGINSLKISDLSDILLLLGNKTSGTYTLQWDMYVSTLTEFAFYGFQKYEDAGLEWGAGMTFSNNGFGVVQAGGDNIAFDFPSFTWFSVAHFIDLDEDAATLFINDLEICSWKFSETTNGFPGVKQLGAINFFSPNVGNTVFIDDVLFYEGFGNLSLVTGKMHHDEDGNCLTNGTEAGLPDFMLHFEGQNGVRTRMTNPTGTYKILVTPGTYEVNATPPNTYWEICPYTDELQVPESNDTLLLDFVAKALVE